MPKAKDILSKKRTSSEAEAIREGCRTEAAFHWVLKGYGGFLETETEGMALHTFKSTFIVCQKYKHTWGTHRLKKKKP